jgi:RNA polymerase sigma-70 factor (ECF subfamily)
MRDQPNHVERRQDLRQMPSDWVSAYRRYFRFWANLARTAVRTEAEAEDVVHNVIAASLAQTDRKFESIEHIRNYVAKGVLNRAIQVRQRGDRCIPLTERIEMSFTAKDSDRDHDAEVMRDVLLDSIRHLPRRDFEILKLRFYCGLTFKEISQLLRMPVSTLKSREESALKKVRSLFRKNGLDGVI